MHGWGRWKSNRSYEAGEDVVEADPDGLNRGGDDRRNRRQEERVLCRGCAPLVGDPIEVGMQSCQQPSHLLPLSPADDFRQLRSVFERSPNARGSDKACNAALTVSLGPKGSYEPMQALLRNPCRRLRRARAQETSFADLPAKRTSARDSSRPGSHPAWWLVPESGSIRRGPPRW